jgi:uncharacterized protein
VSAYLLDANVLIALAWPQHSSHDNVGRWFVRHRQSGWATCPITQMALVRILSNPAFSPQALTPAGALQVLGRNVDVPEHRFWSDSIELSGALERMPDALSGHRQITDAYLVALAIKNKGKLATLDRGIQGWASAGSVELIG